MSNETAYFSRFFLKFVEIIAAGLATAVSGYLIAHFTWLSSSPEVAPVPAAMQTSSTARPPQPAPPIFPDASEQRLAPQPDAKVLALQPAPSHGKTDTNAAERKPRNEVSVETRVRAALAHSDANRPVPPEVPPHQTVVTPGRAAVVSQPPPIDGSPSAAAVAAASHAVEPEPQPVPQSPVQPSPLSAVEIKSRPVAAVDPSPVFPPAPLAREDKGLFSALDQITDQLRHDPLAPIAEAPRPPMPVGPVDADRPQN